MPHLVFFFFLGNECLFLLPEIAKTWRDMRGPNDRSNRQIAENIMYYSPSHQINFIFCVPRNLMTVGPTTRPRNTVGQNSATKKSFVHRLWCGEHIFLLV